MDEDKLEVESSSDEDDHQGEAGTKDETTEIAALRRRRAYIIAQLHNVGQCIRETEEEVLVGEWLPEIPKRDLAPKNTVDELQIGSFLHAVDWQAGTDDGPGPKPLTDRAAERAGALLRLFDADGDGCLNFEEFRAYLIMLGRDKGSLGEKLTTNREFWLNYVMDQAGPPAALDIGGTISFDGMSLTRSGFVGHRRMVEEEQPLELDLLSMGLDLLPDYLQRWQRAKDAFDRIDAEGVSSAAEHGGSQGRPKDGYNGSVERGEAQLLLADAGEVMSKLRVEEELCLATLRAKLLIELVEERRKRNRLVEMQELSKTAAYDSERVYRSAWLSWFLSGRAREVVETSWLEKGLIRIKMGLIRGFRVLCGLVGHPKRLLESLAHHGLISSYLLAPFKVSDARATVQVAIGDAVDNGRGFSVSLNFLHKGNASAESPVEALPPGVGLSAVLDLEGTYESTGGTLPVLETLVLKGSPLAAPYSTGVGGGRSCSGQVTVVKLPDKTYVVRVAMFWRPQANIDLQCRQLKLGLRITDLIRELTISFFCPLQLSQILASNRTVLNDRLKMSLSAECCFCGPLISKIMEETLAVAIDGAQQALDDSAEHALDRAKRQARTLKTAPGMTHPLVTPKRKMAGIFGDQELPSGGSSTGAPSPAAKGVAGAATKVEITRGRPRTDHEKRLRDSKAKRWLDRLWAFAAKLRGGKAFAVELEASSPLEFLDSSLARAYLPASWRSEEILKTPGYVARQFTSWKRSLLTQASSHGDMAREHLQRNRIRQADAEEKAAAMAETEEGRRLAGLEAELARLGVSKALLAETMGEKEEEMARRLRETRDRQMEECADLEDALKACMKCLLGLRELRIQSGPNVLALEMQGLDIFEAFSAYQPDGQEENGGSNSSCSSSSSTFGFDR